MRTGSFNWPGIKTLYFKEVRRFLKVYNQTIIAPLINALLLLAIFSLAMGSRPMTIGGLPFTVFMAPGLIMMSLIQHAFANTSSAFIMGKVLGTIIDYLLPPLSPGEMVFCMVMGGVTRGLIVGASVALAIWIFVPLQVHHWGLMFFYAIATSMLLSIVGLLAGVFADSFDQMSAVTSYVITPLSFLSGTFYSVSSLPGIWYVISHMNPFFFAIDGFRYSLTGYHDGNLMAGMITITGCITVLWAITYTLIARGYRIKT
ncbi:MAG: multidrug ABC transporter permease [Proteobacteria bacterium]|nr:multidrug ABC transporter permease [Pseudomonadota bacterium]